MLEHFFLTDIFRTFKTIIIIIIIIMTKCITCGKKLHDFKTEDAYDCVPPKNVLEFGEYIIDKKYRSALYKEFPSYTSEEVVGSFLGYNTLFPSQEAWLNAKD